MSPVVAPSLASATLGVKRWNGDGGPAVAWDGLRKDADLWAHNGDCNVYLFAKGRSRRGPSFQIPLRLLYEAKCTHLLARLSPEKESDSGYSSNSPAGGRLDLHIPVPDHLDRQESLQWHIATRNFFAWLMGKPVVGDRLGQSIMRLLDQMKTFRDKSVDNTGDLLTYLRRIGYSRVTSRPDHALAMLLFAENGRLKQTWLNAFVHCVGMNDILQDSIEYEPISDVSKALITRAHLYMDIHLERTMRSLDTFIENELSPTHLGLSPDARTNLDEFRSFLISYSVARYGYWPPENHGGFPKDLYKAMKKEFQSLYDYLVDYTAGEGPQVLASPASGGMCVQQNIDAFNERHKFTPLPSSMPLVPKFEPGHRRSSSHKSIRTLIIGARESDRRRTEQARVALMHASNHTNIEILSSELVQAYIGYENDHGAAQGDDVVEARKVRWILVYGVLQVLNSVLDAPPRVEDAPLAPYPLCCSVADLPSWEGVDIGRRIDTSESTETDAVNNQTGPCLESQPYTFPSPSIHPDCEANDDFHILFKHQVHPAMRDKPSLQRIMTGNRPMSNIRRPSMRLKLNPSRKAVVTPPRSPSIVSDTNTLNGSHILRISPLPCSPVTEFDEEAFVPPPLMIRRSTLDQHPTSISDPHRSSLNSFECGSMTPPSLVSSSEPRSSNELSDSEGSCPVTPTCLASARLDVSLPVPYQLEAGLPAIARQLRMDCQEGEEESRMDYFPEPKASRTVMPLDRLAGRLECIMLSPQR